MILLAIQVHLVMLRFDFAISLLLDLVGISFHEISLFLINNIRGHFFFCLLILQLSLVNYCIHVS